MDTALKYAPLVSAVCATVMLLWTMGSALWAKMTATDRVGPPPGQMRWWRRPIPVMIILACLAWLPSILTQLDVLRSSSDSVKPPPSPSTYPQAFGTISTLNFFSAAQAIWERLPPGTAMLVTAPRENFELQRNLAGVFQIGARDPGFRQPIPGRNVMIDPPNYAVDLDAPRLPESKDSGITVNGHDPNGNLLLMFQRCFVVHKRTKIPDGLAEYYKVPALIWIEIGPGNPWRDYTSCSG
jgi:hypothetical protein